MKTQNVNNKLKFDKNSISELNDQQMLHIGGEGIISLSYHENAKTEAIFWITAQW